MIILFLVKMRVCYFLSACFKNTYYDFSNLIITNYPIFGQYPPKTQDKRKKRRMWCRNTSLIGGVDFGVEGRVQ